MTQTPELLPVFLGCPFCGAEHGAKTGGPKLMVSDSQMGWVVRCTGCLARASSHFQKIEAIATWNTRSRAIHEPASVMREEARDGAISAAYLAIYGPEMDPFQHPEGWEYAASLADAILAAIRNLPLSGGVGGQRPGAAVPYVGRDDGE